MVKLTKLTTLLIACFVGTQAHALDISSNSPCLSTETALDINTCAAEQLTQAKNQMEAALQKVKTTHQDDTLFLERLMQAQSAWKTWVDTELAARFPTAQTNSARTKYGSLYPNCRHQIHADMMKARTKHLQQWLNGTEEGDVCAGSIRTKKQTQ